MVILEVLRKLLRDWNWKLFERKLY